MTWQRIDENTYIDDTLVTCAEYQLFIDEMREQGKYYQPDHWTSYQFRQGQAREPILGVRHSDASMFCKWLSQRDTVNWFYRLPVHSEIENLPLQSHRHVQTGCWIISTNFKKNFYWLKSIYVNSRCIGLEEVKDFMLKQILNRSDEFDPAQYRSNILDELKLRDFDLNTLLKRSNNLSLDVDDIYESAVNIGKAFPHSVALAASVYYLYTRSLLDMRENVFNKPLYYIIRTALDLAYYERDRVPVLNLFLDLYTLRERIAGRSPAFEGIRLVKERIK
jgi:hypothetical protein